MNEAERAKFERDFAEEFAAYEEENRPKGFWFRFREQPVKHVTLFASVFYGWRKCLYEWAPAANSGWEILIPVVIGIFWADFLTGFIHMYCDMVPLEPVTVKDRPFIQWAAFGFHYHHANMQNWNTCDVWYGAVLRAGSSFYFPISTVCFILDYLGWIDHRMSLGFFSCAFAGLLVQFFHIAAHGRWNDRPWLGPFVKTMQRIGVFLPPQVHRDHHKHFDRNFAILTGWSTPILNWMFNIYFRDRLDPGVHPEVQRKVYFEEKDKFVQWPYYVIFPKWRESINKAAQ